MIGSDVVESQRIEHTSPADPKYLFLDYPLELRGIVQEAGEVLLFLGVSLHIGFEKINRYDETRMPDYVISPCPYVYILAVDLHLHHLLDSFEFSRVHPLNVAFPLHPVVVEHLVEIPVVVNQGDPYDGHLEVSG